MQQSELKHELVLPENFPLIRMYRFFWGEEATLDFCHLFWGTLFFWLVPLVLIVLLPFYTFGQLKDSIGKKIEAQPVPAPPKKEPLRKRVALLDKLITAITKFNMWRKWTARPWYRSHLRTPVKYAARVILLGALLGGLAIGLYNFIPFLIGLPGRIWAEVGLFLAVVIGMTVATIALILISVFIHDRRYDKRALGYAALPPMTAFRFMRIAYHYVKTNTCPRIVVNNK